MERPNRQVLQFRRLGQIAAAADGDGRREEVRPPLDQDPTCRNRPSKGPSHRFALCRSASRPGSLSSNSSTRPNGSDGFSDMAYSAEFKFFKSLHGPKACRPDIAGPRRSTDTSADSPPWRIRRRRWQKLPGVVRAALAQPVQEQHQRIALARLDLLGLQQTIRQLLSRGVRVGLGLDRNLAKSRRHAARGNVKIAATSSSTTRQNRHIIASNRSAGRSSRMTRPAIASSTP